MEQPEVVAASLTRTGLRNCTGFRGGVASRRGQTWANLAGAVFDNSLDRQSDDILNGLDCVEKRAMTRRTRAFRPNGHIGIGRTDIQHTDAQRNNDASHYRTSWF